MITPVTDHQEQALTKLIPPFWGKPRMAALFLAFLDQVQELEDAIAEVVRIRTLDTADMPRLKIIGKIVGQPSLGYDLEAYRRVLRARIGANRSRGVASDVLDVAHLLFDTPGGDPAVITLQEVGTASVLLVVWGESDPDTYPSAEYILPDARGAGISLELFVNSSPSAPVGPGLDFILGDSGDPLIGDPLWSVMPL